MLTGRGGRADLFVRAGQKGDDDMQHSNASVGGNEPVEMPYREGTIQAFEQILSGGVPVLYRQAYRLLGNRADAEDAVQDALLAAYTHLGQFQGHSRMSSWVTAIVLNSARMRLRTRIRDIHVPLDETSGQVQSLSLLERLADPRPNPEDEYRKAEFSTRLRRGHSRLSPTLHRTFQLRAIEGLSVRETAQILGVPIGTVKAQFARARKRLKELMRQAPKPLCVSPPSRRSPL